MSIAMYLMHSQCVVVNKLPHKITLFGLLPEQRSKLYRRKTDHIPKIYGSVNQPPASKAKHSRDKIIKY